MLLALLHWLGRYRYLQIDWSDLEGWIRNQAPEDVLGGLARLLGLVLGYWLLVSTLLYSIGVVARVPNALRSMRWIMLPGTRRLLDAALALSVLRGAISDPAAVAAAPSALVVDDEQASSVQPERPPDDLALKLAIYPLSTPLPDAAPGSRTHVVEAGDSLWSIAESQLGDATQWPSIWQENRVRFAAAGLSAEQRLPIGAVLVLPATASSTAEASEPIGIGQQTRPERTIRDGEHVEVASGDNLWEIAHRHLARSLDREPTTQEVVPYWQRTVEANRQDLASGDPNLIYPGEVIEVPPIEPDEPVDDSAATSEDGSTSAPPPSPPSTRTHDSEDQLPPTTAASEKPQDGTAVPEEEGDEESDDSKHSFPIGLAAGGMAVAGLVVLLERRRRAQLRRRSRGHLVAAPEPDLQQAEGQLREASATVDGSVVDVGLRQLAAALGPRAFPLTRWVESDGESVLLVLTNPATAPEGITQVDEARWCVSPLDATSPDLAPPLPLLCPIGHTPDGSEVLVDLEADVIFRVGGAEPIRASVLRSIAVAVATSPWSSHSRTILVGMSGDIARLPNVEVAADLDTALTTVEGHGRRIQRLLTSLKQPSTYAARPKGGPPDAWDPVVIVSAAAPDAATRDRLNRLTPELAGRAVAIVCPEADSLRAGRACNVEGPDTARVEGIDLIVKPHMLKDDDVRVAVELLDDASQLKEIPTPPPAVVDVKAVGDHDSLDSLDQLLGDVEVLVRVFGETCAVARDAGHVAPQWPDDWREPLKVDRVRALEAICYLAIREGPVDIEDLESALFPSGTNARRTYHNAVTGARRALGEELFPHPESGQYHLSERVATDYALFCHLVAAAAKADVDDSVTLLRQALSLVRGEPFVGPGRGFAWVGPHRGMIVAQVIDAAEDLAEKCLGSGDWRGAEWAARQGKQAFPADERMHRILMRSAHTAGNMAGVQRAYDELVDALSDPDSGVEPEDTVHPETIRLLEELTSRTASPR